MKICSFGEILAEEYAHLREDAGKYGLVHSQLPDMRDMGRMSVDAGGACQIELRSADSFDFGGVLQGIRDKNVKPKPGVWRRMLGRSKGFDEAWENASKTAYTGCIIKEHYAARFPNRTYLVTFEEDQNTKEEVVVFADIILYRSLGCLRSRSRQLVYIAKHSSQSVAESGYAYKIDLSQQGCVPDFLKSIFNGAPGREK